MSITLAFITFSCGTNFGKLRLLLLLSRSKLLPLMSFLYKEVWALNLLGWEDRKGLDTEAL